MNSGAAGVGATSVGAADEGVGTSGAALHHMRLMVHDGQRFGALSDAGRLWLTPAAGCLLQPQVGDLVLASSNDGRKGYILTVLERANPQAAAEVSVQGDLHLNLPDGQLNITAARGMAIDAGPRLELSAAQWQAAFQRAELSCQAMHVSGQTIQNTWHTRTDVCSGTRIDIAARNEAYFGSSTRRVSGHEESAAQSLRQQVDRDWTLRAGTASLDAEDQATINASSIQIG